MDSDKLQASEKSQKSRAILGRSAANGIVSDQVHTILILTLFFMCFNVNWLVMIKPELLCLLLDAVQGVRPAADSEKSGATGK